MEKKTKPATSKGPADWFTGDVWLDGLVQPHDESTLNVAAVHFHPGARTAWHSHDGGQHLYVTEGEGRAQSRGEPVVTIRPGDVVWTPSGEEHWHGAAPDHFMTHLSMTTGAGRPRHRRRVRRRLIRWAPARLKPVRSRAGACSA